jgi:hypothetical protein
LDTIGKHRREPKFPPSLTLAKNFAAVSPPTVSATQSTLASPAIAESWSMATVHGTGAPEAVQSFGNSNASYSRAPCRMWMTSMKRVPTR